MFHRFLLSLLLLSASVCGADETVDSQGVGPDDKTQARVGVGRVVDENDAPIAGAEVTLRTPPPTDMVAALLGRRDREVKAEPTSTTDAEGRFEYGGLAAGRYDLEVRARGFAPAVVPGVEIGEGSGPADFGTVVLARGAALKGRVADPEGRPIAGAEVSVHARLTVGAVSAPPRIRPPVQTAADGRFVVADLTPGQPVTLAVAKEGYGLEITSSLRPPAEKIAVVLRPAGRLRGRVVDTRGEPIEGARVMALPDRRSTPPAATTARHRPVEALSAADGRFLIEGVKAGTLQVMAQAPGYPYSVHSGVELTAGDEREIKIVLDDGAVVEGKVTTAEGAPVAGAAVRVFQRHDPALLGFGMSVGGRGSTDAAGRYRVDAVPAGPASITVSQGNRQRLVRSLEVQPGANVIDMVLERGFEVSGRVVGPDGAPMGGTDLSLNARQPGPSFTGSVKAVSGADGAFTFTDVAAGKYSVLASRKGLAPAAEVLEVSDDVAGLLLKLGRGATLKGRLLGLGPDELGSLTFWAASETGVRRGRVDSTARYAFDNLAPGRWFVQAQVASSGRMTALQIEIPAGVAEVEKDIEFGAGFTLSGVVLDRGEPLAGADVGVVGSMSSTGQASTDPGGRFRIDNLKAGSYQLVVAAGRRPLHSEPLELTGNRGIRIEIHTGGISGSVRDAVDGEPMAGARVALEPLDGSYGWVDLLLLAGIANRVESDSRGFFKVPRVRQGRWRLLATKEGYAPYEATVAVTSGTSSQLEIRMTPTEGVSFEVAFASGTTVPWVTVTIFDPSGRHIVRGRYAVVEGRVRVSMVPPGRWELVVQGGDSVAKRLAVSSPGDQGRVALPQGGALDIRVPELQDVLWARVALTGPDGKPFVAAVDFRLAGGDWLMSAGQARILGLAPGPWSFIVKHSDGRTWTGSATVTPGSTTEVSLP